jgi:hypothetical protein
MKKLLTICAVAGLILAANGAAQAVTYVSTFNVDQEDFSLTGFSMVNPSDPTGPRIPTTGPDYMYIDNVTGTYNLDIPPAGGSWDVYVSGSVSVDYDKDGVWDDTQTLDNEYLGNFASPGPSTSWGPGSIPFTVTYNVFTFDFILDYQANLDGGYPSGSFGSNAYTSFTLSGDPAGMLLGNTYLTEQDNLYGGGDGIIDGWMAADLTVTCVPEPATLGLLLIGGLALLRRRRA